MSVALHSPLLGSQILIVPNDPEASIGPFHATKATQSPCPLSVAAHSPLRVSQILISIVSSDRAAIIGKFHATSPCPPSKVQTQAMLTRAADNPATSQI